MMMSNIGSELEEKQRARRGVGGGHASPRRNDTVRFKETLSREKQTMGHRVVQHLGRQLGCH